MARVVLDSNVPIAAYMRRVGIEYCYSFGDDFDAVESVTRVDTPMNPYA